MASQASGPPDPGFLSGQMLIAMPGIGDPRFERSVLLVCAHDEQHAMGLAVNRPVAGLTVPDLLEKLEIESDIRTPADLVLLGGPVDRERGFVLHTRDYQGEHSVPINDEIALTATREVLEAMAGQDTAPRLSRLALGYAGWGPGQLEREIRDNVWLTCPPDEALLFGDDHEGKWARALQKLGVDPGWLTQAAGSA